MSLSFPAAQVPLIERPHGEPLYFAHIYLPGETLYFSDRNFKFNGHDYEAYLFDIPETVHSIERFGGYLNVNAGLHFRNLRFRSYDRLIDFFMANPLLREEMDLFVLYLDDGQIPETDLSTKLHKFSFGEFKNIGYDTLDIELFSILHSLDHKKLFTPINRVNWPNAAPDAIGKYENLIYGPLRGVPCHPVIVGAVSTLYSDLTDAATEIYLSDVDYPVAFPSSGTVQIGIEQITYTAKDSTNKKLTGCTRGSPARAYTKGEPIWEIKSTYKYLAAGQKMKSISDVYVAGIRIAPGDRTVNLNDSGKSTIAFTSKNLLKNQGAHSHGATIEEPWYPTGSSFTYDSDMGAWGAEANLKDRDEGTGCGVARTGVLGFNKDAYFTATFPAWNGITPNAVYVYIVCNWNLGYLANEYFNLTSPETIQIGVPGYSQGTYTAKLKLTGSTPPTTVTVRAHTNAGNPVNLIVSVYEIWMVLEFDNIASGGENSVWSKLVPLVTCDGEGFQDDGSGTYTGSPNVLIENSSDQRRHLLVDRLGRSMEEIGDSFATMRTTYANRISGGYKFGMILSEIGKSPEEIFRRLDEQSRSQMREDGGKFELAFHDDSEPSSVMTIDKTIYVGEPVFSQTPVAEMRNVIRAVYDFDWSRARQGGRYGNFFKQIEIPNLNGQRMLADFDGGNGETSFTDPYGNVFTGYNGAQISTAASKFGSASARYPGPGRYFQVPSASLNQFTMECFFRMDNKTLDNQLLLRGQTEYKFAVGYFTFYGNVIRLAIGNGSSYDQIVNGSKTSWNNDQWYHLEFSYDGLKFRVFVDGALDSSIALSRTPGTVTGIRVGGYPSYGLTGYIDEFRFTPYCLHTGNFTPPSAAYSSDIITDPLPEDVEYPAIQVDAMAIDVATWQQLQKRDVIPLAELRCNKKVSKLQRNDYFTLNNVPAAIWEGKKWKVLQIRRIAERQEFQIKAIQFVSS